MSTARRPLPTDLVALVTFDGRVYPNEAKPLDRMGLDERARPLEDALEQWFSFATGKHTWVSVRGATIRGLISARKRGKQSVWEVDALIAADEDEGVTLSLFSRMSAGVMKQRAERVFLRLDSDSHLVKTAREAGFFVYCKEILYRLDAAPDPGGAIVILRKREKADLFGIFQLYMHTVPANVRAIEGATYREWQAGLESWGARTTDLVLEEDSVITAWVRVSRGPVRRFSVLSRSESVTATDFVRAALSRLSYRPGTLSLVPEHNPAVVRALREAGFVEAGEFVVLAKRLARPVGELAQEAAGSAVPVS